MRYVVLLVAIAAACGNDGQRRQPATDTPEPLRIGTTSQAVPALDTTADTSAFAGSTERVERKGSASEPAILNAVRTARHEAFERVVLEFRGEAMPDYFVEYAREQPTSCGSGEAIVVAGAAHLVVRTSPAQAHAPIGGDERSTIPGRTIAPTQPVIKALAVSCDFEGVLAWVVGVDARRGFRVTTLSAPPRLVIDLSAR
ncbi:MAG TPA: hypothetical protein VKH19_07790 [Gemmatimonadaceae bacterium]|nr:hypothetical protein [Gemmatimonadaceae bacterium]